jgi:hypothetical protein
VVSKRNAEAATRQYPLARRQISCVTLLIYMEITEMKDQAPQHEVLIVDSLMTSLIIADEEVPAIKQFLKSICGSFRVATTSLIEGCRSSRLSLVSP